jgi:hypothetical protein
MERGNGNARAWSGSENRFSEKIMLKQRDEIMMGFLPIAS